MPVLEADSPVGEYRKITEEILRLMPNALRYPRAAAEASRSFLMLRLGLHLGVRQKNLRELLICPKGRLTTAERHLEMRKRGELRLYARAHGSSEERLLGNECGSTCSCLLSEYH